MLWRDASIAACVLPPRPGFINVSAMKNGRVSNFRVLRRLQTIGSSKTMGTFNLWRRKS
jgi:hypothetical protein